MADQFFVHVIIHDSRLEMKLSIITIKISSFRHGTTPDVTDARDASNLSAPVSLEHDLEEMVAAANHWIKLFLRLMMPI